MKCRDCGKSRRGTYCSNCGAKLVEPTEGEALLAQLEATRKRCKSKGDTEGEARWKGWHDLVFRLLAKEHAETQVLKAEKPKSKDE